MATPEIAIALFYQGWESYHKLLVNAIMPLTAEQLELQVAPYQRSVNILIRHIISVRVGWFREWMGEGSTDLDRYDSWEDDAEVHSSASELVQGLEATWQMIAAALHRWTSADMGQVFPNAWRANGPSRSRQWIIWHVLEHDLHHGGEVSLTLGTHGLSSIDL